jgi:hypothetical protein
MPGSPQTSSASKATQAYRRTKARAKARSAAQVLAGQDIGPIPPVGDPARRALADESFRAFCDCYFPRVFTLPWSDDHLLVIRKIEQVVIDHETLAVAMPRGSGKTTLCLIAVLWALLTGRHPFVFLIASTAESALALLDNLKQHLMGNELLLADYPEAVFPIRCLDGESRRCLGQRYYGRLTHIGWTSDQIVLPTIPGSRCSGALVRVAGITGHIRGAVHIRPDGTSIRPTLVVGDDLQTDQSARSLTQVAERLSIINGAIYGLAGPGRRTAIIIPCTVIRAGDVADQLLDRDKNPLWQGERTKLVYAFPTPGSVCEKLWSQYASIRADSLRRGDQGHEATEFYREHQAAMDEGVRVAWPARHDPDEVSAVQHAMNLKLRDEAAFWAEYQNQPLTGQAEDARLTPQQIAERTNGRPRRQAPVSATVLTAFIDVHDRMLFYCVCAWEPTFTGYVIDYGTFPRQPRRSFTLRDAPGTLAQTFPGMGVEASVQAGLEQLVQELLHRDWPRGEGSAKLDRILIDSGYLPGGVANACHKLAVGNTLMPSKGVGLRAANRPMSSYRRRAGEIHGHHWYVPNVSRTREFRHVLIDTNHWKSFVHARLATAAGDPGSLTMFGRPGASDHRLFAEHLAGSETCVLTTGHGRTVQEWSLLPAKPDNHWFDCLVGCAVAASMCGIRLGVEPLDSQPARKRYTQDDLRRRVQ